MTQEEIEKKAIVVYPKDGAVADTYFGRIEIDNNAPKREGYVNGYEQAEHDYESIIRRIKNTLRGADYMRAYLDAKKDFAITPEDVAEIFNKVRELQVKYPATEGCYAEVAEWFNNLKEEKK